MYGIKCRGFDAWSNLENEDFPSKLAKRAEQIRQMTESTHPKTIDSIREAQDKENKSMIDINSDI